MSEHTLMPLAAMIAILLLVVAFTRKPATVRVVPTVPTHPADLPTDPAPPHPDDLPQDGGCFPETTRDGRANWWRHGTAITYDKNGLTSVSPRR